MASSDLDQICTEATCAEKDLQYRDVKKEHRYTDLHHHIVPIQARLLHVALDWAIVRGRRGKWC